MSNKLFGDNVSDYFVDGSSKKGYLKSSNKGYAGDASGGKLVSGYGRAQSDFSTDGYFEGKKSNVGTTVKR